MGGGYRGGTPALLGVDQKLRDRSRRRSIRDFDLGVPVCRSQRQRLHARRNDGRNWGMEVRGPYQSRPRGLFWLGPAGGRAPLDASSQSQRRVEAGAPAGGAPFPERAGGVG